MKSKIYERNKTKLSVFWINNVQQWKDFLTNWYVWIIWSYYNWLWNANNN